MMYRYGYPYMGGFGFEWIFMIIFWVIIIWAILALARSMSGGDSHWHMMGRGGHMDREDEAMKILKERYAKGEINKEEFEQKKSDLIG